MSAPPPKTREPSMMVAHDLEFKDSLGYVSIKTASTYLILSFSGSGISTREFSLAGVF